MEACAQPHWEVEGWDNYLDTITRFHLHPNIGLRLKWVTTNTHRAIIQAMGLFCQMEISAFNGPVREDSLGLSGLHGHHADGCPATTLVKSLYLYSYLWTLPHLSLFTVAYNSTVLLYA